MRRIELELEHRYKNRFVGKHRLVHDSGLKVLGASREAHIRLLGDHVEGVHATIECLDGQTWTVADMGSEHGTWVKKKPIVEHVIKGTTVINIGGHHLKVVPHEINSDLFKVEDQKEEKPSSGNTVFHQVVVRKNDLLVDSLLLEAGQSFEYLQGGKVHQLKAPTEADVWSKTSFGDVEIQQRLVRSDRIEQTPKEQFKSLMDPDLKAPTAGALLMIFLMLCLVLFSPEKPMDELEEMKPEQNKYTRIIYDAKKVKEKKETANVMKKNIAGHSPNVPEKKKATGFEKVASAKRKGGAKVINNIKAAGLGALIGKISKRAAKSAEFIQAAGKSPDSRATGRALGLAGGSTIGKEGKVAGGGEGHKIGGVSTDGKGGGSSAYKGVGGLSLGNVGNATVGVLEEETEVEGGLDRDVIARVIQSKLGQIRYCYERQLSASPDLYGKVKVKFTIGAAGSVIAQTIGTTSLNNAMVEGCILRRIAGWQFPTPRGGTQVIVSYPFLFKSTQ